MHVGYSPVFQNLAGKLTDREVYAEEVRLAELAEPLGFDFCLDHGASLH